MTILFLDSNLFQDEKFSFSQKKKNFHIQNFGKLFIEGLQYNSCDVSVITVDYYSNSIVNRINVNNYYGVCYTNVFFLNIPILRPLTIIISSLFTTISWVLKNRSHEKIIICNTIHPLFSIPSLFISKIFKTKSIGLVADFFPEMNNISLLKYSLINKIKRVIGEKSYSFYINKFDYYVLFSELLNEVVNKKKKPYVIIEGMVDINLKFIPIEKKRDKNEIEIVYAGGLFEKYGVKNLIEAFRKLNIENLKLSIYGSGELEVYIKDVEKQDNRIKYWGVVSSSEIFKIESNANLLINPRPTNYIFSKYSFPSKVLEYMASGTSVLTTKLKSMPKEYEKYLYFFDDESVNGIFTKLQEVLSISDGDLVCNGQTARDFVLEYKNNIIQTKYIIDMIN
jgi:glycosyltransferase involved in cell wall biosynthesis